MTYPPQQGPAGMPPLPPQRRNTPFAKFARIVLGISMGIVALVVIVFAVGDQSDNSSTANSDNAPPVSVATTEGQAATADPASPTTEPLAQKINDWATGGGGDLVSAIGGDLNSLSADSSAVDFAATGTDCTQLSIDTDKASDYAPIPDETAQTAWSKSLKDLHDAAADCIVGTSTQDASYIEKSGQEVRAGNTQIGKATDRIQAIANG